ncbi:MAG: hypothetical protein QM831_10465 [Kofleriaceae bacterium]
MASLHPQHRGFFDPIEPPPVEPYNPEPHAFARSSSNAIDVEDVEREPDGVPHAVVGLTAFWSVIFAILVLTMFFIHSTVGKVGAAVLLVAAVPLMVKKLNKKAERDRDHVHPSR